MAKQQKNSAHVPKFGNWDNDGNVPYTVYFDNARKGKGMGVGAKPMNPTTPSRTRRPSPPPTPRRPRAVPGPSVAGRRPSLLLPRLPLTATSVAPATPLWHRRPCPPTPTAGRRRTTAMPAPSRQEEAPRALDGQPGTAWSSRRRRHLCTRTASRGPLTTPSRAAATASSPTPSTGRRTVPGAPRAATKRRRGARRCPSSATGTRTRRRRTATRTSSTR